MRSEVIMGGAMKLILLLVFIIIVPCSSFAGAAGRSRPEPPPGTLAIVDADRYITEEDYRRAYVALPQNLKEMAGTAEGRKEMLDTLVTREMILIHANREGIDKDPAIDEVLYEYRKKLVVETYLKLWSDKEVTPTEAMLKEHYRSNKSKYMGPEQVRVSHILVEDEKTAKLVLKKLKSGEGFEKLVATYSIDASKEKGGDLGWVTKGMFVAEFEKAAFKLDLNKISGVVKTEFGYHIIKATGKQAARPMSFEEAREQVSKDVMPTLKEKAFAALKEQLRDEHAVQFLDGNISKMVVEP